MLSTLIYLLAIAATTLAEISPLFHFVSTAKLPIEQSDYTTNPTGAHAYEVFYRSLASCPTKHYAVIVEPSTLSYTHAYIPSTPNAQTTFSLSNLDGQVNINFVLNVILMDCLHHGVLRVEELNPTTNLPDLDRELVRKSILWTNMPEIHESMARDDYLALRQGRQTYVEQILNKYFENDDYTLIYVREREVQVEDTFVGHDDGKEIPLVADD